MFNEMEYGTYYEPIACALRASLSNYFDTWLDILSKEECERPLYLSTIERHRITVIVLSCMLIEHNINFYLSTKCTAARFEKLQRNALVNKWTDVPKEFVPTYTLPVGSELAKDLNALVNRRNAIVHAKPKLSIDGDNRHAGNEPPVELDENAFIERCASMPSRLLEHLLRFDQESFPMMSTITTSCGSVMHELTGARYRVDWLKRIPEELINEIMQQGHRRDRAKLFAALIGEVPKRRSDGSIAVRRYCEEIARLKPLKFFANVGFVLDLRELSRKRLTGSALESAD